LDDRQRLISDPFYPVKATAEYQKIKWNYLSGDTLYADCESLSGLHVLKCIYGNTFQSFFQTTKLAKNIRK
jgi:hypothetical protein